MEIIFGALSGGFIVLVLLEAGRLIFFGRM